MISLGKQTNKGIYKYKHNIQIAENRLSQRNGIDGRKTKKNITINLCDLGILKKLRNYVFASQ